MMYILLYTINVMKNQYKRANKCTAKTWVGPFMEQKKFARSGKDKILSGLSRI